MPRLSGCRSGRPPSSLPSAPRGAQSDLLPKDSPGAAPSSRRREPASADRHRGHRGRSPSRASRPARALRTLTVFLVAVAALLALPLQAQAQTTFVSNVGQTDSPPNAISGTVTPRAQQFETGSNTGGYTLAEIVVNIQEGRTETPAFALYTSTADDKPGTKVVDLSGNISTAGTQSFTPASTTTLSASTKYFIVFSMTSGSSNLQRTLSNAIDSGASTGWDIAENSVFSTNSGTSWTSSSPSVEIAVKGTLGTTTTTNTAPAVDSIAFSSVPNNNTYGIGDEIEATVTFSEAVDITGTPQLELDFAGTPKAAACTADTGTEATLCSYTVVMGDSAPNGIAIAANKLTLNGGTITATGSTTITADLDHAAVAIDADHKVDGIRPTLVTTGSEAPTTSTDGTQVILTFSETIGTVMRTDITIRLTVGSTTGTASTSAANADGTKVVLDLSNTITSSTSTLTVALAANAVEDGVGNGNLALAETTVINVVPVPTVSGVALTSAPGADNTYAIGDVIEATVAFSGEIDITGTPQLELDFAGTPKPADCLTDTNTNSIGCYYTVAVNDSAPNGIAIGANKLTGGTIYATGSTTATVDLDHVAVAIDANHKVDGIRPTLVTTGSNAPTTSTDGTKVILTFSETISSVDLAKITIGIGGGNVAQTSAARVAGTTVELDLSTVIDATVMLTVALAADAVEDDAGNGNLALAATGVTNAVGSTTAPTVTGIALTSTPTSTVYHRGEGVEATVTFDAAVDITGTPQLELDFDGTPKAAACTADTGTEATLCSYTVVMGDSAPNGIAIAANKLTLNGGTIRATGSTTANADLDHVAVAIDTGHKVDGIRPTLVTTGSEAPTTSTDGTTVILTFSEDIRSVNRASITIQANGVTLSTTAASRAGTKAELTLATALTAAATNLTVSLAPNSVFDAAGNGILFVAATAVTNAVGAPDPPGTLKARRGDGEVHLEWVPVAAVPTDPDRAYQLRYGAEGGESNQWRDIPRSAPGGPHARSYTVTRLENGTRYAFELRVRRDSGFGTAAKIRQTPQAARWSVSTNRRSVHEGEDVTLSIATRNAVGFYSAPEVLTLAVIAQIVLEFATIDGADPEDFEIRVDGTKVQGYTKDITLLNFDKDLDRDPFPAQHFDVEVPVGSTSLDVTVTVLADEEEDGQEHMSFMVFRGEELVNEDTWDGTGVNIESRDAGVVKQLAVADAEATEGEDPSLDFVVTLAPAAAWTVTVDYATHDGTARAGSDYTATSGALTFAPGETAKTVSVPVINDTVEDTPETLTVRLSNANPPYNEEEGAWEWGSQQAGVLIADAVATGTIRNTEDQAEPRAVSVSDASAAEGDSGVFTVSLSATSSQQVTVDYATADGTATAGEDYTATSGTLTFQAGETTKTISVPITDDTEDDGGETFTLTLSNASGADLGDAEATGTIRDTKTAVDLSADFPESAFTSKRHTGSDDRPQVVVAFSEAVAEFAANTPSVSVTGASGVSVQTHTEDGLENAYVFFMTPDGDGDVTFALTTNAACAAGGICTADGTVLTQVPAAWTIPSPEAAADDDADDDTAPASLTAAFGEVPAEHDGQSAFNVRVEFSEDVGISYKALRDESFSVTDGDVTGAQRIDGRHDLWEITVEPDSREAVTISLPGGSACGTAGAVCTRGDNPRQLTNSPSATVTGPPDEPLRASFRNMPAEHDGSAFTFDLNFSENIRAGYARVRDDAFSVSGGNITKAQRQTQGSNQNWTVTVQPSGNSGVSITLPATTDCDAVDAICTEDGRPLSHSLSETIASPVGISVADARVEEGAGAVLEFAVTLSRAAAGQVTVDYQTVNGTASAGTDYTAADGTLTFEAGESSQTVEVAVLDDSHDEGEETMTLRLSNPSEGRLADAEATGTIENTDPLPRALLARFGRATALHVMEQVEVRLEASRASGFRGRFAGRELRRGMERDMGRNFLTRLQSTAGAGARDTMGVQSDLSGSELLRTGLGGGDVLMGLSC